MGLRTDQVATRRRRRPTKKDIESLAEVLRSRLSAAVVCISHSWGGLEQVAADDALELAKLGLEVRMVCLPDTPIHRYLEREGKIKLELLDFRPRDYLDLRMRAVLRRLILDEKVNLVHTHQTTLIPTIVPWVWSQRKIVICATRHIMNDHNKKNFFHSLVYQRLDALVVMSEALKWNILNTHNLKERQVKVIHLGLDFAEFDPRRVSGEAQRAEWGADKETIVIGMVGRIDPAKGQDAFIKAAAGLNKYDLKNSKIRFVLVGEETRGSSGEYVEELKALVKTLHLEDKIVFAGFKESIPEVMRAFDIFVMPSRQEAFGLVAIEAMAMECPIIISRGGSSTEIVGAQEFGLLIRADDAYDLQSKLKYLLDHPSLRRQMGKRAREHVMKNYDQSVRLQKTLELYERCLRRRGI